NNLTWYNGLPNRFFTFTGDVVTGLNSNGYGYAEIVALNPSSCLVYSAVNSAATNAGPWGTLSGSGAPFSSTYTVTQLVEVAINFSDFGLDLNAVSGACFNIFGSMMVKTRSSSSWSSELKDLSGPFTFGNFSEVQASAGTDKLINCTAAQVALNGSSLTPGAVYTWSTANGNIVNGANSFSPTVDQPGTYVLTVSSPSLASCVTSDTVVVTRDTIKPVANAGSDWQYICSSPSTFVLNGNGTTAGTEIQWTAAGSGNVLADANTLQPTVDPTGCYVLTITNPLNTCFAIDTVCGIAANDPPVVAASIASQPSCDVTCNGSITLAVSGSAAPYSYTWSDGSTDSDRSGLCAGTYTVIVTGQNACTSTADVVLVAPAPLTASAGASVANVSCAGGSDGAVSVVATGGTAPYSGDGTFTGLNAGPYTYTVTDANGCTATVSVNIVEPLQLAVSASGQADVSCFGGANGQVDVIATGGTAPYTGAGSITGLTAGSYTYIVTDANGCSSSVSVSIAEPTLLSASSSAQVNASCFGNNDGSITVTASGGVAPYTGEGTFTQLTAGTDTYVVTEANGCAAETIVSITEPQAAISVSSTQSDILCYGNTTAQVDVTVNGGTQPFGYSWSNGQTQEDLSGVGVGTYDLVVTDANGCTQGLSVTITGPSAPLSTSGSLTAVSCFGGQNGGIALSVSGGTAGYSYVWSSGQTTSDITGVSAGTYSVLVTDANGCTSSASFSVVEPAAALASSANSASVLCNGGNDGSIDLTVSGGTAPYTFAWSNSASTEDLSGLSAGIYSVVVTDVNGCTTAASVNVAQPVQAVVLSATATGANCISGQLGTANASATGGTAPYTFAWSNGSTSASLNGLNPGSYTVTVTDANGCASQQTLNVDDNSVLDITTIGDTIICVGESVEISADPVPNASYQWLYNGSPLQGATNYTFTTLVGGIYQLQATTPCGTYNSNPIEVVLSSLNAVTVSSNVVICWDETTQLDASGGLIYSWSPGFGLTDSTISNPVASPRVTTNYTVTVTDELGCSATGNVTVTIECDPIEVPNGFSPNNDGKNDTFVIDGIDRFPGNALFIYNRWGNLVYKEKDYANQWDGRSNVDGTILGQELPNGTYFYILDLNTGDKPLNGFVMIRR
ncbi:MAG: gliding motility-associated C-terminal domain-containing protein, partial [Bacteroidota bacterium]